MGGLLAFQFPPIISIIGYKNSGKTTVSTRIIEHLTKKRLRTLSAKHVGEPDFSLDRPGTDSFRHLEAGASAIFLHSTASTSLLLAEPIDGLEKLLHLGLSAVPSSVIVLEGFRAWTHQNPQIAKIVCIRTTKEITQLTEKIKGPVLALCSLNPNIQGTKRIPDEFHSILTALDRWLSTNLSKQDVEKK